MEKNKRDLMILIAILFLGLNYAVYTYFVKNQLNNVSEAKSRYISQQNKLYVLEDKRESIDVKKQEVEKLKQKTTVLDKMAPEIINTPQLIYDFYRQCSKYGITGRSISFQLAGSSSSFNTLEIDLKIVGNGKKVEDFIRNLGSITTDRRINVKSINIYLPEYENTSKNDDGSTGNDDIDSNETVSSSSILGGEIVFYEYIQGNGIGKYPDNYVFYDSEKEGFSSISDMFK